MLLDTLATGVVSIKLENEGHRFEVFDIGQLSTSSSKRWMHYLDKVENIYTYSLQLS